MTVASLNFFKFSKRLYQKLLYIHDVVHTIGFLELGGDQSTFEKIMKKPI